jgi:hypothetical protein
MYTGGSPPPSHSPHPFMGGGGEGREGWGEEAVKSRQISLQALITESACLGPHTIMKEPKF